MKLIIAVLLVVCLAGVASADHICTELGCYQVTPPFVTHYDMFGITTGEFVGTYVATANYTSDASYCTGSLYYGRGWWVVDRFGQVPMSGSALAPAPRMIK